MTSPHLQKLKSVAIVFSGFITLSLFASQSNADAPTPPTAPSSSPAKPARDEALFFLQMTRIRKICEKPITFSVQEATVDDVAIRIEKLLQKSELKPKVRIETRRVQPVRLTFSAKKAPIGDILTSAADLSGVQLWIFSDYLLLAPEKALSPTEQSALRDGLAMETNGQFDQSEGLLSIKQTKAFLDFISNEVKGFKSGPTAQVTNAAQRSSTEKFSELASISGQTLVASTSFGQLSPNAQEMIQELFGPTMDTFSKEPPPFLSPSQVPEVALSSNTPIAILGGKDAQLAMFFKGKDKDAMTVHTHWNISGTGGGWSIELPFPRKPPTSAPATPALPLDPSAGKS